MGSYINLGGILICVLGVREKGCREILW